MTIAQHVRRSDAHSSLALAKQMLPGAGAILALTLVAYWPSIDGEFVWDDETNVTNNATLRSLDGLRQMWFEPKSLQQYYPLMYTSYWLEYRLWGLAPAGYHVTNILLHVAAAILVWQLLRRLNVPGAWLAGAIFALHPVAVESVAWVTERKNVLSLSLALLSMLCYLRFSPAEQSMQHEAETPGPPWRWYGAALAIFILALFAKTVVVTLPAVLLVIYWWKRGGVTFPDIANLFPFVAMSVIFGLTTAWLEVEHVGAHGEQWSLGPIQRLLLAGRALWFYAGKLAWPHPLALFYERWELDARLWWQYLFPAVVLALLAALWLARRQIGRGPLAAVLIFAGVLVPALGFFNVYFTQYAQVSDHFQYHASVALIALAAASAAAVVNALPAYRSAALGGLAALLAALGTLTFQQTHIFHDLETLYRDTMAKNPRAWIAYLNLGTHLDLVGRPEDAVQVVQAGLQIRPDEPRMHACMGNVLGKLAEHQHDPKRRQEAFEHYLTAARLNPEYGDAYRCLGFMLLEENPAEAQAYFARALRLQPRDAQAVRGLGAVAGLANDWASAEAFFRQSLEIDPKNADARCGLALALSKQNQVAEATKQFQAAIELDPGRAEAHFELGNLLVSKNDFAGAIRHYNEAVKLRQGYIEAMHNLGAALLATGNSDSAIGYFNEVLRLEPDHVQARANLERAQLLKQQTSSR